jgi:hypothetical protein
MKRLWRSYTACGEAAEAANLRAKSAGALVKRADRFPIPCDPDRTQAKPDDHI